MERKTLQALHIYYAAQGIANDDQTALCQHKSERWTAWFPGKVTPWWWQHNHNCDNIPITIALVLTTWCWYCSDGFPYNPNPVHYTLQETYFAISHLLVPLQSISQHKTTAAVQWCEPSVYIECEPNVSQCSEKPSVERTHPLPRATCPRWLRTHWRYVATRLHCFGAKHCKERQCNTLQLNVNTLLFKIVLQIFSNLTLMLSTVNSWI